jgi:hypothetical protein
MLGFKHFRRFSRVNRVVPGTNLVTVPFGIAGAALVMLGACPSNTKFGLQTPHIVLLIEDVHCLLYASAKYSITRTGS